LNVDCKGYSPCPPNPPTPPSCPNSSVTPQNLTCWSIGATSERKGLNEEIEQMRQAMEARWAILKGMRGDDP